MSKSKKKNIKVRDLNPKKDAKGGFVQQTSKQQGNPNTGSSLTGGKAVTGGKSIG
jgi:hypothetical protein